MISHLVDEELLYKSYLNNVIVITVGCLQPKGITNGDGNLPIHDLFTPVTIILLSVKLKKC